MNVVSSSLRNSNYGRACGGLGLRWVGGLRDEATEEEGWRFGKLRQRLEVGTSIGEEVEKHRFQTAHVTLDYAKWCRFELHYNKAV